MRSFLLAAVLSLTACAHSAGPSRINVHAVRVEIKDVIAGERTIISMGKVTATTAEVYTETAGQPRRQESWVKVDGAWKLQDSHDVASAQ